MCHPECPPFILATLVGAIALARAVDDPGLSEEILERVARMLHRHVQGECAEERDAKFGP